MSVDWIWNAQREVRCPDGTIQYVFKNIDRAFPFFFKQAKMSTSAALDAARKLKGKIDAQYAAEIQSVLVRIDEKNGSIQAHLRASYVLYAAAPCKKLDQLEVAIREIRESEHDLRTAELALNSMLSMLQSPDLPKNASSVIADGLAKVTKALSKTPSSSAAADEMKQVSSNTEEWRQP